MCGGQTLGIFVHELLKNSPDGICHEVMLQERPTEVIKILLWVDTILVSQCHQTVGVSLYKL